MKFIIRSIITLISRKKKPQKVITKTKVKVDHIFHDNPADNYLF